MTAIANHPHVVHTAVTDARASLVGVAESSLISMDPEQTVATIEQLTALAAQVAELQARVLLHAESVDVPGSTATSSVANWYGHHTRTTRREAHRTVRIAKGLERRTATRQALAEGRVQTEQAEVILRALAELPADLEPDVILLAEKQLLDYTGDFDAKALRHLGRHILEVVSPEAADAHEAKLLEKEEREAAAATRLTMWDDEHGKVHGRFTVDTLTGAMLKKALMAFAAPKHRAAKGPLGDRLPTPQLLGQAFVEMIQRYPRKRLPKAGGLNATVLVMMDEKTLMGDLEAAAQLDTGERISPGAARRLACEAGIRPVVLGTDSEVLDLGREARFGSEAQRIVKAVQSLGCEVDGCDAPPGMTHLHHPTRWADGGETNRDQIMICPWHHRRAHDPRYTMTRLPTGKYTFHRRQ